MSEELYQTSRAKLDFSQPQTQNAPLKAQNVEQGNNTQKGGNNGNNANLREDSVSGYRITSVDNSERILGDDDGTQINRVRARRETQETPFELNKILQTSPSQYPQLGSQIHDLMERDPGFKDYYAKVQQDGSLEQLINLEGVRGIDQGFLDTMQGYYNVPHHQVAAAMAYYGLDTNSSDKGNSSIDKTQPNSVDKQPSKPQNEYPSNEDGDIYTQISGYYNVPKEDARIDRMIELVEDWYSQQPDDVRDFLAGLPSEFEKFQTAYRRARGDQKREGKAREEVAARRAKMPTFTQAEIDALSPQEYERLAPKILEAYRQGLVK